MALENFRPQNKKGLFSFLQKQNWFVSAGLVLFMYPLLWYYLRAYSSLNFRTEEVSPLAPLLLHLIHVLPLFAAALLVRGIVERKRQQAEEQERKKKRYEIRMTLDRLKREEERGEKIKPGS